MPPTWRRIREVRRDLTDYLIHWTGAQKVDGSYLNAFQVLKRIIGCGYFKPGFGQRQRVTAYKTVLTVQGPNPVVCFTEQPLSSFITSCKTMSDRYRPYGVVINKSHLYKYGGRPAIYGDKHLLQLIPDDYKFLWVHYDPIPEPSLGNYPVDWSHEREWRAKVNPYHCAELGLTPSDGVPLLLPPVFYPSAKNFVLSLPRFIVNTSAEATELKAWIAGLPPYKGENGVLKRYFSELSKTLVIPLEEVEKHIILGESRWERLETLPYKEIDPSLSLPMPESYF